MTGRAAQFHALYRKLRISDQLGYYRDRRVEYQLAHEEAMSLRNALLVLSAVAGITGQLASDTGRALFGVAAAVLAALAGAVTAFEGLIGFSQLRKLYGDAELSLESAVIDWDAEGPGGDLETQVDRIEGIFHTETGQWGQLTVENAAKQVPKVEAPPPAGPP